MFWNMTFRRLGGIPGPHLGAGIAARPDLETGNRLLAVATEAGVVVALSGPPGGAVPADQGTRAVDRGDSAREARRGEVPRAGDAASRSRAGSAADGGGTGAGAARGAAGYGLPRYRSTVRAAKRV